MCYQIRQLLHNPMHTVANEKRARTLCAPSLGGSYERMQIWGQPHILHNKITEHLCCTRPELKHSSV